MLRHNTIVIIDDERLMIKDLKVMLSAISFEVVVMQCHVSLEAKHVIRFPSLRFGYLHRSTTIL